MEANIRVYYSPRYVAWPLCLLVARLINRFLPWSLGKF